MPKPEYDPTPLKVPGGIQHLPNRADLDPEERERLDILVRKTEIALAAEREKRAKAKALAAERATAMAEGRYATLPPGGDVRAFVDRALDGAEVSPQLANPTETDNAYWELVTAPPTARELEESKAYQALNRLPPEDLGPPENKGLDADLEAAAERAVRLQARWEKTVRAILDRHAERREAFIMAKLRSAQFRKGTRLWDPPGDVPLVSRAELLTDRETWDRELTDEMTTALTDLHDEAVASLDFVVETKDDRPDIAAFILRWIRYTLRFNVALVDAVNQILTNVDRTREPDVEEAVQNYIQATADVVGDRTATAIATGATNEAQLNAARRSVTVVEKIWFTSKDGRVRKAHRAMAGKRVPIIQPFIVKGRHGTFPMEHPGDITAPAELWMNCRCVMLFVTGTSPDVWQRPDGSPIDPYGRSGGLVEPKGFRPSDLGFKDLD